MNDRPHVILENALKSVLELYFSVESTEFLVGGILRKEKIGNIREMEIFIYSNDHNPPHFHVKSKDGKINAKFKIENCELLNGEIGSKDLKKVEEFFKDQKTQIIMKLIWSKKDLKI